MTVKPTIKKTPQDEELFLHEMPLLNDPQAWILDMGAGPGSVPYGAYRAQFAALDQTIPANAGQFPRNATFIHGNAVCLPFLRDSFDLVIANFIFEHFWTPDLMLQEVERVLKPGGLAYISVPNAASLEDKLYNLAFHDHLQKYSFHSFLKIVYETTRFKLVSFADWPAGYTWLNAPPVGKLPRRAALRLLQWLRPVLRRRTRKDSGFIFLFRKEAKLGYRSITHICANCGGGTTIEEAVRTGWLCAACGHLNR